MATYSVNWSAVLASTVSAVSAGTCLVMDSTGYHYPATSTNRGLYGRTMGVCFAQGDASNRSVQMIEAGLIPASITGLATGTVSWVRASSAGLLERCTPGVGDDIVGQCHADGSLQFMPGVWDSTNYAGGSGGGGTVPTGDGFVHITAGAQDAAATALTFTGDTTGTGTAASIALTTAKINGITISGTPAIGNQPVATSTSAAAWSALNLAGGSNYVTGSLPIANVAAPTGTGYGHVTSGAWDAASVALTWTGDATGTGTGSSFALTVVKVNGATIPAAGALTTGNVPQVSGLSALTYAPLNIGGGSNFISGTLPVGNGGTGAPTFGTGIIHASGTSAFTSSLIVNADVSASAAIAASKVVQATGTGFPHVTAGALDAASIKVDTTNSAHVTVPATANGVVTSSGTVLQQASNVLAGTDFVSIGASPATAGFVRLPQTSSTSLVAVGTSNVKALSLDVSGVLNLGDSSLQSQVNWWSNSFTLGDGVGVDYQVLGSYCLHMKPASIEVAQPVIGDSRNSSPWGAHGKITIATAGTYTLTAAEYQYDAIMFSASTGGTYTFPLPADDAHAYYKTIIYTGNSTAVITNTGGAPKNVTVSSNTTVRCLFDTVGVHPVSTAAAYP